MTGVKFDNIHSVNDLGLSLSTVEITPPEPKTYIIEIAGADGSLDLTEALTGDVKYKIQRSNECPAWKTIFGDIV